jgi:hypothetical protein
VYVRQTTARLSIVCYYYLRGITIATTVGTAPAIAAARRTDSTARIGCRRGSPSRRVAATAAFAAIGPRQALDCAIANNNLYASTWLKILYRLRQINFIITRSK